MALGRQMAAGGAEAEVERQPTQPRLHQRDIAAAIRAGIRREMLAAEPVATRAALHHRVLIPVVVASRRVALRRDEKWRRLTHGEPGLSFVVVRRGSLCFVVLRRSIRLHAVACRRRVATLPRHSLNARAMPATRTRHLHVSGSQKRPLSQPPAPYGVIIWNMTVTYRFCRAG